MPRNPNPETQCQQVFPSGRRCRLPRAKGHPSLCLHHSQQAQQAHDAEAVAAQLLRQIEDFTSAAPVNQFLANLLKLTARGLVPRRDAAVLAYIAQSLLNGLAARRRELLDEQALAENEPVTIVWDLPRPDRGEEQSRNPDPHSDRARYQRLAAATLRSERGRGVEEDNVATACPVPTAAPG